MKDTTSIGFLKSIDLSSTETFETKVNLLLIRRQTNKIKDKPHYHFLPKTSTFDYPPPKLKASHPLTLRIVSIKLSQNDYELLITDVDPSHFQVKS